jgi:N6-adenosine-specific RNA methylase IME4
MDNALIKIDEAKRAIAEARDITDVLEIRDRAMSAHVYALAKNYREAADIAKEAQLRAERRAGDFLAIEVSPGRPEKMSHDGTLNNSVKLDDLGLTRNQSSRWQAIASIPEPEFERYVTTCQGNGRELTQSGMLKLAKHLENEAIRNGNGKDKAQPGAYQQDNSLVVIGDARQMDLTQFPHRYGVIIADPPWPYQQWSERKHGAAKATYDLMTMEDLYKMPVPELAADNCILFLWGTWPKLPEAVDLMKVWGFEHVTGFPWVKTNKRDSDPFYGVGFWVAGCSEYVLIGRKGQVSPPKVKYLGLLSPTLGHSRKPDSVHELAEKLSGPYLELFARRSRPDWTVFGNEIQGAF